MELQGGIEDPEEAEDDLQGPLGPDGEGEPAVLRLALFLALRAPVGVHALLYAIGGPVDASVRLPSGQVKVLGDAVDRRHGLGDGLPDDVVVHVQRRAVQAGIGHDVRPEPGSPKITVGSPTSRTSSAELQPPLGAAASGFVDGGHQLLQGVLGVPEEHGGLRGR